MRVRGSPMVNLALSSQIVCAALVLITGQNVLANDIYKTVDEQGRVVYSDHAVSPSSQKISVQASAPNLEEAARIAKEQAIAGADTMQEARQRASERKKKAAEETAQKQRCDAARNYHAVFAAGGRIYKADEHGNRVYYSDHEIDAERAAAKAAMDSACDK